MAAGDRSDCIEFNALPVIDLRMFSQPDLRSFSIASNSSLSNLNRFDDEIVAPRIDRAVFNESAGSRKQTYSRLRLAPRNSKTESSLNRVTSADEENPEVMEALKELFLSDKLVKDELVSDGNAFIQGSVEEEQQKKVIVLALDASTGIGRRGPERADLVAGNAEGNEEEADGVVGKKEGRVGD